MIGPRGSGKSTAVQAAAKNRDGTLSVTVTKDSDGSVYEVIAEAIRAAEFEAFGTESLRADGFTITTDAQLALVMRKAAALRTPHDPSWIPTLIAEVEQRATDETVTNVAKRCSSGCAWTIAPRASSWCLPFTRIFFPPAVGFYFYFVFIFRL